MCFYVHLKLMRCSLTLIKVILGTYLHVYALRCINTGAWTNLRLKLVPGKWTRTELMCIRTSTLLLMQFSYLHIHLITA